MRLGASTSRWPRDPIVLAGADEEELQLATELIEVLVVCPKNDFTFLPLQEVVWADSASG